MIGLYPGGTRFFSPNGPSVSYFFDHFAVKRNSKKGGSLFIYIYIICIYIYSMYIYIYVCIYIYNLYVYIYGVVIHIHHP